MNSTARGALLDFTSIRNDAEGGTGVDAGIGVDVGVAVGPGVLVGLGAGGVAVDLGVDVGESAGVAVRLGASVRVSAGASGKAVAMGVSAESEGIIKSHADRNSMVSTMNIRNIAGYFSPSTLLAFVP